MGGIVSKSTVLEPRIDIIEKASTRKPPLHPNLSILLSSNQIVPATQTLPNNREILSLDLVPETPMKHDDEYYTFVAETPSDRSIFKYHCPLCMRTFENILIVSCCRNYICLECSIGYLDSKGIQTRGLCDIVSSHKHIVPLSCPHCMSDGFNPVRVGGDDPVRDYHWSPRPTSNISDFSPLKVGESFENMKRKMLPIKTSLISLPNTVLDKSLDGQSILTDLKMQSLSIRSVEIENDYESVHRNFSETYVSDIVSTVATAFLHRPMFYSSN